MALVTCATRYKPESGSFAKFATPRIDGALLDWCRHDRLVGPYKDRKGEEWRTVGVRESDAIVEKPLGDVIDAEEELEQVFRYLDGKFSERDVDIYLLRVMGDLTLREVGEIVGLSHDRIRQIVLSMQRKLVRDVMSEESLHNANWWLRYHLMDLIKGIEAADRQTDAHEFLERFVELASRAKSAKKRALGVKHGRV